MSLFLVPSASDELEGHNSADKNDREYGVLNEEGH
jgi:hypothetical protein